MIERILQLHELVDGTRLDLAVEQMATGAGFVFEAVWFRRNGQKLYCEAVLPLRNRELTPQAASELIRHAQACFQKLRTGSPSFEVAAKNLDVHYSVIDDYGMGTAIVCRLVDNKLVWT